MLRSARTRFAAVPISWQGVWQASVALAPIADSARRNAGSGRLAWFCPTPYSSALTSKVPLRTERRILEPDSKKATVQKLTLMSVIFAAIIIAARAARLKNPQAGLKKALVQVVIYNLFYVFLLMYVVGRL
jgi:hypothetical protein